MATTTERYEAAIAYVKRAIAVVKSGAAVPDGTVAFVEWYAARKKTETPSTELERIEARWLRATTDVERTRIARDAELLADRVQEDLPGAPQDRQRTDLVKGEKPTATAATSYAHEANEQFLEVTHAREAIDWIRREGESLKGGLKTVGQGILIGGGLLVALRLIEYASVRRRQGGDATARRLNRALEQTANNDRGRNASTEGRSSTLLWLGAGAAALLLGTKRGRAILGEAGTWLQTDPQGGPVLMSDDVALARVITSEARGYSETERTAIAWTVRNRARKRGVSITRLVCWPSCGPCCQGRPFSSARPETPDTLALARKVLAAPQSEDPTKGALAFFEPKVQDQLVKEKRPGYRFTSSDLRAKWQREGQAQLATVGKFEFWA
jgi:hypothetical protein